MKDLLGNPLTPVEKSLHDVYERLKALAKDQGLPPCALSNVRVALAAMAQVMNDLDIVFEQLAEEGV
jgi:P2-related tail formation protein